MSSQSSFLKVMHQPIAQTLDHVIVSLLFGEGAVEQPSDNWKVAALIICWENDRVFVLGNWRHIDLTRIVRSERIEGRYYGSVDVSIAKECMVVYSIRVFKVRDLQL